MTRRNYLCPYYGNKDREIKEILKYMPNLDAISTIIEPFGGSFSLIRELVFLKYDKKFIVGDLDSEMIETYKDMQNEDKSEEIIKELEKIDLKNISKENYVKIVKNKGSLPYLVRNLYYNIRPGLFPSTKRTINIPYERLSNFKK
jgi:site-specific DNA-adenine methylase